ncbi:ABC transporter permease [Streptococcus dentiloxodontae]
MYKQVKALLWSRREILLANKAFFLQMLLPLILLLLFKFIYRDMNADMSFIILLIILPMSHAVFGMTITLLIADENEKGNMNSLVLSGVTSSAYLTANLFIPLVIDFLHVFIIPLVLGIKLVDLGWTYWLVNLLTAWVIIMLFIGIGILMDSQQKATIVTMPLYMIIGFLPMMTMNDKLILTLTDYTPVGALSHSLLDLTDYRLLTPSFFSLIVWLVVVSAAVPYVMKRTHIKR